MVDNIHKKTVKIGEDIIEAEYYEFGHSKWLEKKKIKTFKDVPEKIWDIITTPYYIVRRNVKNIYWEFRYGLQRMFKDYDSVDVFDTFSRFTRRYTKILTDYKKNRIAHPATMTDEEWEAIVDNMLYHLHYMDEDVVTKELEKDIPDSWYASCKTVNYILNKHKDEFFKLFSEYFYCLWD